MLKTNDKAEVQLALRKAMDLTYGLRDQPRYQSFSLKSIATMAVAKDQAYPFTIGPGLSGSLPSKVHIAVPYSTTLHGILSVMPTKNGTALLTAPLSLGVGIKSLFSTQFAQPNQPFADGDVCCFNVTAINGSDVTVQLAVDMYVVLPVSQA
jgi:hypothetical protein